MKRISVNIYLTYISLFKDLIMWGQVDPYDCERDLTRIRNLCETRGERTIFIDFPSCAKVFDKALSCGFLDTKKLAILGSDPYNGLPAFMNSTFRRLFNSDGILFRVDPDVKAVQAIRQVLLLYKKVEIPCSEEKIRNEIRSFFSIDRGLRPKSLHWDDLDFIKSGSSFMDGYPISAEPSLGHQFEGPDTPRSLSRLSQRVCDQVVRRFRLLSPDSIVGNHGPGAVADSKSGLDKYVFPTWSQQLERVFPRDIHAAANVRLFEYDEWYSESVAGGLRELPAKLIPVNKTQEKPRLIASEPTANQFMQGGLKKFLRAEIESSILSRCLTIRDQTRSRGLALEASKDDRLATVDLSAASDRLSCWTVERAFREAPALLNALAAARSRYLVDGGFSKQYAELRKYAPQGNATVFPLQSIIYSCLTIAAVIWSDPRMRIRSDALLWKSIVSASSMVRVYGDDIILPAFALPALSSLLEFCQLKVNGDKSHFGGLFAESCGMDAFNGTDVTPVYMHSVEDEVKPGDVQSAVDVSNACYAKGLLNLGNLVQGRIPEKILDQLCISHKPGPSTLLRTFSSGFQCRTARYNSDLCRDEALTLISLPLQERIQRDSWESLLQYYVEGPSKKFFGLIDSEWASGWTNRVRTKLVRRWVPKPE